jgi:hypothetical protein
MELTVENLEKLKGEKFVLFVNEEVSRIDVVCFDDEFGWHIPIGEESNITLDGYVQCYTNALIFIASDIEIPSKYRTLDERMRDAVNRIPKLQL